MKVEVEEEVKQEEEVMADNYEEHKDLHVHQPHQHAMAKVK